MSEPLKCLTYSGRQAAVVLGVSHHTVARMVRDGKLPSIDTGSNRLVIPKWAVDRLVAPPETVTVELSNAALVEAGMREAS